MPSILACCSNESLVEGLKYYMPCLDIFESVNGNKSYLLTLLRFHRHMAITRSFPRGDGSFLEAKFNNAFFIL